MEYVKKLDDINWKEQSVITLGKFDGVHRGHKKLIQRVRELSRQKGLKAVIFTFHISPQVQMGTVRAQMLTTNQERYEILKGLGADLLVECPFTDDIRNMPAERFVTEILVKKLHVNTVVVGEDFHFGKGRSGSPAFLQKMGKECGFRVEVFEKETDGYREISSSYIREELAGGHMEKVEELLGVPYFISGEVVHGRHLGHILGFPTINQIPAADKMLPPRGVYISRTKVAETYYQGITNIGKKPTVGGAEMGVETHLFQCDRDLYGQNAVVEILSYCRPEQKFHSMEELKEQLHKDVRTAHRFFEKRTEFPIINTRTPI